MLEDMIRRLLSFLSAAVKITFVVLPIMLCLSIGSYVGQWYTSFGLPSWFPVLGAILFLTFVPEVGKWLKKIVFWWKDESQDR